MDQELAGEPPIDRQEATYYIKQKALPIVDIAQISATGFHFNMYQSDNEVFYTIMYEIDLLIKEKEALAIEDQETMDLICIKLSAVY